MFIKSCIIAILSVLIINIIKQYRPEYVIPVAIGSAICLIWILIAYIKGFVETGTTTLKALTIDSELIYCCVKLTAISYIRVFCCNFCRDYGHTSLSSKIDLIAKFSSLVIIFPWISKLYVDIINLL